MPKSQKLTEFHVLEVFVDELDTLHKLADKCLANEWLEHKTMEGGNYSRLLQDRDLKLNPRR